MNLERDKIRSKLGHIPGYLTIAAGIAALLVLFMRALVHFPYFSESVHMQILANIAEGLKPGIDFFSGYPALAYLFLAPFLKLFPETALVLIPIRFISIAAFLAIGTLLFYHSKSLTRDWIAGLIPAILLASSTNIGPFLVELSIDHYAALAAVGAMVQFFRQPRTANTAVAAALCVFSVAITPKYAIQLFFGFIGYLVGAFLAERKIKQIVYPAAIGAILSAMLVTIIFQLYDISLIDNVIASHINSSRLGVKIEQDYLLYAVYDTLFDRPALGIILILGVIGWGKRSWRNLDSIALSGAGILVGTILLCFLIKMVLETYQTPVYISLLIFTPYAFIAINQKYLSGVLRAILAVTAISVASSQISTVASEFRQTNINLRDSANPSSEKVPPGVAALLFYDELLRVIPKNEKIAALWLHNPFFRRDVGGMTCDDRPSYSEVIGTNNTLYKFFDPAVLRLELEKSPPAMVDPFQLIINYPPGWVDVLKDFVETNSDSYTLMRSPILSDKPFFLRKDLAAGWRL